MNDPSWDNSGAAPEKKPMGLGVKIALGCGGALLLLMTACTVGGFLFHRMVTRDPEGFRKRAEAWGQRMVHSDWARLKGVVDQLQTDEGARALYAQGDLKEAFPTEAAFLKAVRGWRPGLAPLPEEAPLFGEGPNRRPADSNLLIHKGRQGTTVRYHYPGGVRISVTFQDQRVTALDGDAPAEGSLSR